MIYGLLVTLYIVIGILLTLIVLIQKGKSSMGLGNLSGSTQMIFGSGGQDIFQKTTWALGAIFMAGSLILALMKSGQSKTFRYVKSTLPVIPAQKIPEPKPDSNTTKP